MKVVPIPTPEYNFFLDVLRLVFSDTDIVSFGLRYDDEIAVTLTLPSTRNTLTLIFALNGELVGTTEALETVDPLGQKLAQNRFLDICNKVRTNSEYFERFCEKILEKNFWIHENFEIAF